MQKFMCYCTNFALFYFEVPGACVWRGDLSQGFLCYEFGGLIFEGAYFRNFMVFRKTSRVVMIQSRTKHTECIWKTYTTTDRAHKNQLQSKKDAKQIFSWGPNCLHFFFKILLVLNKFALPQIFCWAMVDTDQTDRSIAKKVFTSRSAIQTQSRHEVNFNKFINPLHGPFSIAYQGIIVTWQWKVYST